MIYETTCKQAFSKTKIPIAQYVVNPYVGCSHACRYCYAQFIGPFKQTGGRWGKDVWVKINLPQILEKDLPKAFGRFFLSSICDPYQHAEKKYGITRKVLEILKLHWRNVRIMTKSTLILRDLDLLKDAEVVITITTDSDQVRRILEPGASSIEERIKAVEILKQHDIKVGVFVGPVLPMNAKRLAEKLAKLVDTVTLDKLNYPWLVKDVYKKMGWEEWLKEEKFFEVLDEFQKVFGENAIF
ncbi:SPL family radical SAM protein [Pseudothermotoga thermarum]|uniref:Radical SAM domain protein n=1 Tax=Pseudothermotoga thermarum DSM 5069 TaxID=688269 RepID=F7YWW5_9THEM|nr:radical SAM protein [Pseudothermotoga thermarum]AEH50557.1 Radical SAM domain protein [Pseudothermotoga thermarum DSM 5069]